MVLPWSESCSWGHRLEWSLQWDLCQRHQAGCHSRSPLPSFHHHWKFCLCILSCHLHLKQPQPWSLWSPPCLVIQACVLSFQRFLWEFLCFPSRTAPSHPLYNYPLWVPNLSFSYMTHWLNSWISVFCGRPHSFIHSFIHSFNFSFTHLSVHFFQHSLTFLSHFQSLFDWAKGDFMCNMLTGITVEI